jgi:hypothetical protein
MVVRCWGGGHGLSSVEVGVFGIECVR